MLEKYLPAYYRNSKVMRDILGALETEYTRLKKEIQITEDTFFVLFSDKYIDRHLSDLGLEKSTDDLETKQSRILARLRGQGTLTISALCNVINAYVYGSVRVEEYANQYLFKIRFVNEKGNPKSLNEIMSVVEELKPAHLAVDYIFTYRVWQEIQSMFVTWAALKPYTWEFMRTFEVTNKQLHIRKDGKVYMCVSGNGNAKLEWLNGRAYAVLLEEKPPLHIAESGRVYFCVTGEGNAKVEWHNNRAYAVRLEE